MDIKFHAYSLCLKFTKPEDIPTKYIKKTKSVDKESKKEIIFKQNQILWESILSDMINKIGEEKTLRLVSLKPINPHNTRNITEIEDWITINDYLYQRRDIDICQNNELGFLSQLSYEIQRILEANIPEQK